MNKYRLLKDFDSPTETIEAGAIRTTNAWSMVFQNMKAEDYERNSWFELVDKIKKEPKVQLEDLIQCESCEGHFGAEKAVSSGDVYLCKNCNDGFKKEARQAGIDNLDEFLKARKMEDDFSVFMWAKFQGVTKEEIKDQMESM